MELEPDVVHRLETGRREVLALASVDPVEGRVEALAVAEEARVVLAERAGDPLQPLDELPGPGDDLLVVIAVGVVVRHLVTSDIDLLPRRHRLEELGIDPLEALVEPVRLGVGPEVPVRRGGEGVEGGLGRVGRQQEFAGAAEPVIVAFAAAAYGDLRSDAESDGLHERFERINAQLLQTMAAWQQIDVGGHKVPNDHSDRYYDEKIITRAAKLVARLKRITGALGEHDPRFLRYGERLDAALDRVDRGQREYLSSPGFESVHNIWFEFHEDLLRSLGKARTE